MNPSWCFLHQIQGQENPTWLEASISLSPTRKYVSQTRVWTELGVTEPEHWLTNQTKQLASLGHVMKIMDIFNQDDPSNYGKKTVLWRLLEFRGSKNVCFLFRESLTIKPSAKGQSATVL